MEFLSFLEAGDIFMHFISPFDHMHVFGKKSVFFWKEFQYREGGGLDFSLLNLLNAQKAMFTSKRGLRRILFKTFCAKDKNKSYYYY